MSNSSAFGGLLGDCQKSAVIKEVNKSENFPQGHGTADTQPSESTVTLNPLKTRV